MSSGVELYLPGGGDRPADLVPGFVRDVEKYAGRMVSRCYQCRKCTSGCPVSGVLDFQCHEVVRLVQLGAKDAALRSRAIWLCASCKTCRERCPNDVDPAGVMDTLKVLAVASGTPIGRKHVKAFQRAFLATVAVLGRAHELGSLAVYLAGRPSAIVANAGLGLRMFSHGKLKILPEGVKAKGEIRAIFRRAREKAAKMTAAEKALKVAAAEKTTRGGGGR
jgi:heterodisulfide reductase subunit C